jgi:hypothetical protein
MDITALSPEIQALLLLSRQDIDDAQADRLRDLLETRRDQFDWPRFLDQATRLRVAPIVSRHIEKLRSRMPDRTIDPSVRSVLRAVYLHHLRRNRVLRMELRQIVAAASRADVPMVVRKGGHLGFTIYRDPAFRPMSDLDVFVSTPLAEALMGTLRGLGYQEGDASADGIRPLSHRERVFWRMYGSDLPKYSKPSADVDCPWISLDINVRLMLPGKGYDIPVPELLSRVEEHDLDGERLLAFAAEDTLIDLCTSLYKNATVLRFMKQEKHRRLLQFVDLAELAAANQGSLDWGIVVARVVEYGISPLVYYSLAHLDSLFPGTVPDQVLVLLRQHCTNPDALLDEYGQWDLPEPMRWRMSFLERFFDPSTDREIPASASLV